MPINTFCVSGRLTRNPEMYVTKSELSILKFGLAHNERRKIDDEWVDVAHFFECSIFGGYGEMLEHKLRKGDEITATGKLSWSQWENDAGEKRSKVELIVNQIVGDAVYRTRNGENPHPQGETRAPDDIPDARDPRDAGGSLASPEENTPRSPSLNRQTDDIPF